MNKKLTKKEAKELALCDSIINGHRINVWRSSDDKKTIQFISCIFGQEIDKVWHSPLWVSLDRLNGIYRKLTGKDNDDYKNIASLFGNSVLERDSLSACHYPFNQAS